MSIAYWDEHAYASVWAQPGKEGSPLLLYLISVRKDEEMTKFYNDLKAAEATHAAAAMIIQGTDAILDILTVRTCDAHCKVF
jgi:hypothetical protein